MSTTASLATAPLGNDSLLSQCADFVETMLHRFLKSESEKQTPPTPAELQPAVNTLWRLSTIRKNLSAPPKKSSPTQTQTPTLTPTQAVNPSPIQTAPHSPNTQAPTSVAPAPSPVHSNISHSSLHSSVTPAAPRDHSPTSSFCNSEFAICNSPSSAPPPAPTIKEVLASIRQLESATRAAQREAKLHAAQLQPSPTAQSSPPPISPPSSTPKFRYPPPKRTSV